MQIILKFSQFFLLKHNLFFLFFHREGINPSLKVFGLVFLKPVMLCFNFLFAIRSPSWDPVIRDRVEDQARTLLSCGKAFFFSKLLPLSLGFLLWCRFLSWSYNLRFWKINTPESLCILKDLSIISTSLGFLLSFQVKQVLKQSSKIFSASSFNFFL